MRGQSKVNMYPQPEGTLGEYMIKHGRDLGDDNCFGKQDWPRPSSACRTRSDDSVSLYTCTYVYCVWARMMQPFIFMILSLFCSHITLLGYHGLLSLVCVCGCC